jgi:hypothetical protein
MRTRSALRWQGDPPFDQRARRPVAVRANTPRRLLGDLIRKGLRAPFWPDGWWRDALRKRFAPTLRVRGPNTSQILAAATEKTFGNHCASTGRCFGHGAADGACGAHLHIRMPFTIGLMTVSPLMMSSRNTKYMWMNANGSMHYIAR